MSERSATAPSVATGLGTTRYKEYELAAYVEVVRATMPRDAWSAVFFSWLSLKGHYQSRHDFERSDCFVTITDGDRVEALFAVAWHGADTMSELLERGYTVEKMLRNMGVPDTDMRVQLMRDFS